MRDAGIVEDRALRRESAAAVEIERMDLGAERRGVDPALLAQHAHGGLHQRHARAGAAMGRQHADPADLAPGRVEQDAGGAHRDAVAPRQQVDRIRIAAVHLLVLGHALFLDEHGPAQHPAGVEILGAGDDQAHAK